MGGVTVIKHVAGPLLLVGSLAIAVGAIGQQSDVAVLAAVGYGLGIVLAGIMVAVVFADVVEGTRRRWSG